jgi:hypothetical protein
VGDPIELAGLCRAVFVQTPGLELVRREEVIAPDDLQLVVIDEVFGAQVRAPLEGDDAEPRGRQLVDQHAAAGARPDYADIEFLASGHPGGHSAFGESL